MADWILGAGWAGFVGVAALTLGFWATSAHERRWRALAVGFAVLGPLLAALLAALLAEYDLRPWVVGGALVATASLATAVSIPVGAPPRMRIVGEQRKVDEREAVFHRFYRLKEGAPEYAAYYAEHPEQEAFDREVRALPALAGEGSGVFDELSSPFITATFDVLDGVAKDVDWSPEPVTGRRVEATREEFTLRVKGYAQYLGAALVGMTKLNPAYVYSHQARAGTWGKAIDLDHPNAIVVAVEMDHAMVRHAPDGAITTETALRYFDAAKIAMIVAKYVNLLGYEARAHVDGNYRVMCPPIAVDAGLGEIGRLGLLIHPKYGPRLRLSVVTTDLPLTQDEPIHFGVQHFCEICRKCATCCPSDSIDLGPKGVFQGVEKWQTNRDTCYRFWRQRSSDCGICMRVCPYSHPRTPMHDLVRWVVRRNAFGRRLALWGDDLFYGRRPMPRHELPRWHRRQADC